jgi:hypothetical protein
VKQRKSGAAKRMLMREIGVAYAIRVADLALIISNAIHVSRGLLLV